MPWRESIRRAGVVRAVLGDAVFVVVVTAGLILAVWALEWVL